MTKIYKFSRLSLLLSATLLVGAVSCTKGILDLQPETEISELSAFSTPEKILAQVNHLYSNIQNQSFYGGRQIVFSEQRGEEFSQNDGNASVGALIWGHGALSTEVFVNNIWSAGYAAINNANIFIDRVSETDIISDEEKQVYLAEAKFIRALSYFTLVQVYARPYAADNGQSPGLPLRLIPHVSDEGNDLARSSVAKIYEQILLDLDDAEQGLPEIYATAFLNISRVRKITAISLKTRVKLVQGDYPGVIAEAQKIVPNTPPFRYQTGTLVQELDADISEVFKGNYTGSEAVFFLPFNELDAPGIQSSLAANYLGSVVISLNPQGIVDNEVFDAGSNDARNGLTTVRNGQRVLAKFPKITAPYTDYVPVIRYAEVLLNYAEALAEGNQLGLATNLLQTVRNRSDAGYTFSPAVLSNKESLITAILTERRIELLGEGFRTQDIQRRVLPFPAKSGAIGTASSVAPTASNYIWPIPSDEISVNGLIEPNP